MDEHGVDNTELALRALARVSLDDSITLHRDADGTWTVSIQDSEYAAGRTVSDACASLQDRLAEEGERKGAYEPPRLVRVGSMHELSPKCTHGLGRCSTVSSQRGQCLLAPKHDGDHEFAT